MILRWKCVKLDGNYVEKPQSNVSNKFIAQFPESFPVYVPKYNYVMMKLWKWRKSFSQTNETFLL